jgi:hypothetical protein
VESILDEVKRPVLLSARMGPWQARLPAAGAATHPCKGPLLLLLLLHVQPSLNLLTRPLWLP